MDALKIYVLKKIFPVITVQIILLAHAGWSQSTNATLSWDYNSLIQRYEILSGTFTPGFHSSYQAYPKKGIAMFMDSLRESDVNFSEQDLFNIAYFENDNWEWRKAPHDESEKPFLNHFYKNKSDFWHYTTEDFDVHINPVFYFGAGTETEDGVTPWINTRGIELRGTIDNKVGFYSFLTDNQATFPFYVREYIGKRSVVPHEGFRKSFKDNGVDFFTARGYISFQISKHINAQFGHDRFSIGNGYRSLILSDFAPPYLFLKFNTRIGRLQYTNLFTQMRADAFGRLGGSPSGNDFPVKYFVLHHLSINIGKNLNIGLFESINYGREDSTGNNNFDINYLNPIIFYRAIEQQNGSKDNVALGMDLRWNIARKFSFYGQFVLDEFKLNEIKAGDGWWANKYAFQLGGKYINVLNLTNLDLLIEHNYARPYIYSHRSIYTHNGHYLQEIAHPIGANFGEWIGELRYQPFSRFTFSLRTFINNYGEDEDANTNWGKNIFKDNDTREQEYGNTTGQGVATRLTFIDFTTTYHFRQNVFLDLKYVYRNIESEIDTFDRNTGYLSFSFRWNIPQRLHEF